MLLLGVLCSSVFTLLTPLLIKVGGAYGFIGLRILVGLGQGTIFPCLSGLVAHWIPKSERTTMGALVMGGGQIGTVLGNSVSGVLLANYSWPIVFYVMGGLGVIYCILLVISDIKCFQ